MSELIELVQPVVDLLEQMRAEVAPLTIKLGLTKSHFESDLFDPEESQITQDTQGNFEIKLPNEHFADFIVAHELGHLQQERQQIVKIGIAKSSDAQLNQAMTVIAQVIFNIALHEGMHPQLENLNLFTDDLRTAVQGAVEHDLPAETEKSSNLQVTLMALQIADTFTFIGEVPAWRVSYPRSFMLAEKIWTVVHATKLVTNRHLRSLLLQIIEILSDFFEHTELSVIDLRRSLLVTPVLSERQLKLSVRQLFQIFHVSEQEGIYLGLGVNDEQAAFQLQLPKMTPKQQSAKMLEIYDATVESLFTEANLISAPRDLVIFKSEDK